MYKKKRKERKENPIVSRRLQNEMEMPKTKEKRKKEKKRKGEAR